MWQRVFFYMASLRSNGLFRRVFKYFTYIPGFFKDKKIGLWRKIILGFALGYCLIPIDLIPFIPIDDIIILGLVMWYNRSYLDGSYVERCGGDFTEEFSHKTMVHTSYEEEDLDD